MKGIQETPTSGTQTFGDATAAQASACNARPLATTALGDRGVLAARFRSFSTDALALCLSYGFEGVAKEVERIANKAAEVEAEMLCRDDVNRLNLAGDLGGAYRGQAKRRGIVRNGSKRGDLEAAGRRHRRRTG
ncbi:hypothetical protein [Pseudomonas aeruginosa]|uniref:hypothetical protein n=1 Tax=Pseudomonas aeruginosa TaxID=287 RepID=UPI00259CA618|nr:hypothetical protein [Pseudomonas aeruginosa]MDM5016168.1 hypothetical protein [Pseudomonas aeruginosa]